MPGNFLKKMSSADFFSKLTFKKKSFRKTTKVSKVWIQIKPNEILGLIWVQTVCKDYRQTTQAGKELTGTAPISVCLLLLEQRTIHAH